MTKNFLNDARIFIIDDEPSNVRLLERILERIGGLIVKSTMDAREALPAFVEFQPDLVLTDLHMPYLDGYAVMEQFRQVLPEESYLPMVVLTADITAETRRRALSSGASDFITKPLDPTEVQLRIRNLLENRFLNLRLEEQVQERTLQLEERSAQLEQALNKLRAAQEQQVKQERLRALGVMAGGVAHDFNNSLTMIMGYGELLVPWMNSHAPTKENSHLMNMVAAAKDASHIVERLRDFYRPRESDEVREPLEPNQLIEQAVAFTAPKWRALSRTDGSLIQVELAPGNVKCALGSAAELREVFTNLIFNAVDAMPHGGQITVSTSMSADGAYVRFDVTDSGIGMTPEERARCLEPFFTTKGERGTGLGLAVCYGIVQRHNGTINLESTKGVGTTFSIFIPATERPAAVPQSPALLQPEVESDRSSLRILLADDQELICELMVEYLQSEGHTAHAVLNGTDAFASFPTFNPDVVITDKSMPGMTGEQLARAIKEISPHTPVILLSGYGADEHPSDEKEILFDLVLTKPVTLDNLRKCLNTAAELLTAKAQA
jgi:signal transduction histidine kinase